MQSGRSTSAINPLPDAAAAFSLCSPRGRYVGGKYSNSSVPVAAPRHARAVACGETVGCWLNLRCVASTGVCARVPRSSADQ
ncbi:MAG: hypothetical protein EOO65_05750, partial [Methanosarcinales archaeon]